MAGGSVAERPTCDGGEGERRQRIKTVAACELRRPLVGEAAECDESVVAGRRWAEQRAAKDTTQGGAGELGVEGVGANVAEGRGKTIIRGE
ncbi:hypothetical protein CLOP_g5115 [Closterium sp. NIES-67]|nr:hypothetical protein CLOP_g5115 [Closterium sp. NIES-67]